MREYVGEMKSEGADEGRRSDERMKGEGRGVIEKG